MLEPRIRAQAPRGRSSASRGARRKLQHGGVVRGTGTHQRRPHRPAPVQLKRARAHSVPLSGKHRPLALLVVMVMCAGALLARLTFWTVMENGRLAAAAAAQRAALTVESPLRGQIFDAQGEQLATNVTVNSVYAAPKEIKNPERTAKYVAPVVGQPVKRLESLVTGDAGYPLIAKEIDAAAAAKLRRLALPGIFLDPQIRRTYPSGSEAGQVVGYADTDNTGRSGVEGYYDQLLSGTAGLRSVLRDTAGHDVHLSTGPSAASRAGMDLHLSLDGQLQSLAEDELQKAVSKHSADGGTIVVMDPRTGYVLAMASDPPFDPNRYGHENPDTFRSQAIGFTYEPGSTFKIITMAAGLDTHLITPDSAFDDTGQFVVADRTIHNWNLKGFGWETMTQVLQHSANVGAAWVARRLGVDRFYRYVRRFQLGHPTGVGLEGEEQGLLPLPGSKAWTIVNLYTNSFGQGLSITPMQLIKAVGAVANGGVMMKPQIVKQIVYRGHIINQPPVSEGRVISPQTAHTLTDMLVQSAVGGEAQLGLVHGYNIAAKTGTANIAGPNGQYILGATIASIIGYAPAYHPRFIVLVIVNHPRDTPWGSTAAAPVLHNLFQELFVHYHIPPAAHPVYP
jgi:cell division protein FtsI (penicillin-binding protein 3)